VPNHEQSLCFTEPKSGDGRGTTETSTTLDQRTSLIFVNAKVRRWPKQQAANHRGLFGINRQDIGPRRSDTDEDPESIGQHKLRQGSSPLRPASSGPVPEFRPYFVEVPMERPKTNLASGLDR
jgi:hypothetical protein